MRDANAKVENRKKFMLEGNDLLIGSSAISHLGKSRTFRGVYLFVFRSEEKRGNSQKLKFTSVNEILTDIAIDDIHSDKEGILFKREVTVKGY